MLQSLHVKNLALIDEAEVEFKKGLNILSGETGAGKSIIIGSINLALGNKVPKEMLRDNEENAYVELIFSVDSKETIMRIQEMDIDVDDDFIILSRKINGGRAVAKINGEAVSASKMKEVASLLIDIHGQHEHQSLLNKRYHLEYIDKYARNEVSDIKDAVRTAYLEYKKLNEEYTNSNIGVSEREREMSLLEYEINEIEEANLRTGEDEELEKEFRRISNSKKIMEALINIHGMTGQEMGGASELIGRSVREINSVSKYDEALEGMEGQLADLESLVNDFNHELASYINSFSFDDEEFYKVEQRLDLLNRLKTKYGATIENIIVQLDEKKQRYEILSNYEHYVDKLKLELINKRTELDNLCMMLSQKRKNSAKELEKRIIVSLQELNFLDVRFEIVFHKALEYSVNGLDDVEFLISTNPGEAVKPLDKIASGGEMSRIMLALKTIMADRDDIEALIFDEIDSGISGRTAQMVSEKMNVLAKNHQIISITHLPQIAAMADSHYLIEKKVENGRTISSICMLNEEESVSELARMLGGVAITDAVLGNAREMKNLAKSKK